MLRRERGAVISLPGVPAENARLIEQKINTGNVFLLFRKLETIQKVLDSDHKGKKRLSPEKITDILEKLSALETASATLPLAYTEQKVVIARRILIQRAMLLSLKRRLRE